MSKNLTSRHAQTNPDSRSLLLFFYMKVFGLFVVVGHMNTCIGPALNCFQLPFQTPHHWIESTGTAERRKSRFQEDPGISEIFRAYNSDYHRSGLSRGHMAPAGDNKSSQVRDKDCVAVVEKLPWHKKVSNYEVHLMFNFVFTGSNGWNFFLVQHSSSELWK